MAPFLGFFLRSESREPAEGERKSVEPMSEKVNASEQTGTRLDKQSATDRLLRMNSFANSGKTVAIEKTTALPTRILQENSARELDT